MQFLVVEWQTTSQQTEDTWQRTCSIESRSRELRQRMKEEVVDPSPDSVSHDLYMASTWCSARWTTGIPRQSRPMARVLQCCTLCLDCCQITVLLTQGTLAWSCLDGQSVPIAASTRVSRAIHGRYARHTAVVQVACCREPCIMHRLLTCYEAAGGFRTQKVPENVFQLPCGVDDGVLLGSGAASVSEPHEPGKLRTR